MSNEIGVPRILVCPQDKDRKAVTNWADVGPQNVTYRLRSSATNGANPRLVVAVCPVDGNVLYSDGVVVEKAWRLGDR